MPGEIMLIAAAVFAGAGQMDIAVVFLVAVAVIVVAIVIAHRVRHAQSGGDATRPA